jgi:hypothetical protein
MVPAVEKVRVRLARSTSALDAADIPYAVIGGNAVAVWVAKVEPGAAQNTVDVEPMINRAGARQNCAGRGGACAI